jgi:hypothetical protein
VASLEETVHMEMIISQALMNVLVRKGIVTEAEIMEEIKKLKASQPEVA